MKKLVLACIALVILAAVAGIFYAKYAEAVLGNEMIFNSPLNGTATNLTNRTALALTDGYLHFNVTYTNTSIKQATLTLFYQNCQGMASNCGPEVAVNATTILQSGVGNQSIMGVNRTAGIQDGVNKFYLVSNYTAGAAQANQTRSANLTIFMDTVRPNVTFFNVTKADGSPLYKRQGGIQNVSAMVLNVSVTDFWMNLNYTVNLSIVNTLTGALLNSSVLVSNYTTTGAYLVSPASGFLIYAFPADGPYNITLLAQDIGGNTNTTDTINITLDSTPPSFTINSPATNTPSTIDNATFLNVSIRDVNLVNVSLTFGQLVLNATFDLTNANQCIGKPLTPGAVDCFMNITNMTDGNFTYQWLFTDAAGNVNATDNLTIVNDASIPVVNTVSNRDANGTDGNPEKYGIYSFNVTENTWNASTCRIQIFFGDGTGSRMLVNRTPDNSGDGKNRRCRFDIYGANVSHEGYFNVAPFAVDASNNRVRSPFNTTNYTYNHLASQSWNLISATRENGATVVMGGIGNWSPNITSVAHFNYNNKTFDIWIRGISTNEQYPIAEGETVFVFSNTSMDMVRRTNANIGENGGAVAGDFEKINFTLTTSWSPLTFYNTSGVTLGQIVNRTLFNSTTGGTINSTVAGTTTRLAYVSIFNTTTGLFNTYTANFNLNRDIKVPFGYGVWVNFNGTNSGNSVNITITKASPYVG